MIYSIKYINTSQIQSRREGGGGAGGGGETLPQAPTSKGTHKTAMAFKISVEIRPSSDVELFMCRT